VEVAGQIDQRLHDALHVHDHGLHRAGQNGKLLVEEIARRRNALRMRTSLAVQQIPERLTPLAPAAWAYWMISGSMEATTIIWLKVGSCPCTTTLTMSSLSTPRLACPRMGAGSRTECRRCR